MFKLTLITFSIFSIALSTKVSYWAPKTLGTFHLKDVGFIEVYETHPEENEYADRFTMYLTTFNPFAIFIHDPVYRIRSPGTLLNSGDPISSWENKLEKMGGANTAYWPNYSVKLPKSISGFEGVIQTSGFLVPGKGDGKLEVYNEETFQGPWNIASGDSKGWSYHWLIWHDVDADGLLDLMTARFSVSLFGQVESEFVWMKNPGDMTPSGNGWTNWEQHVLIQNGPDVYITMHTLTQDGVSYSAIVAGELWTEKIMIYYVEDVPGAWSYPENIKSVTIDTGVGLSFEAKMEDLNADGILEIVASCSNQGSGTLNAYLMPENWIEEPWTKIVLGSDFVPRGTGQNLMSPGKSMVFYPSNEYASQTNEDGSPIKPWISLSGDDDGRHYILYPESEDKDNWTYNKEVVIDSEEQTVGTMAIIDLNQDGYMELIASGYTADTVYVATFNVEE